MISSFSGEWELGLLYTTWQARREEAVHVQDRYFVGWVLKFKAEETKNDFWNWAVLNPRESAHHNQSPHSRIHQESVAQRGLGLVGLVGPFIERRTVRHVTYNHVGIFMPLCYVPVCFCSCFFSVASQSGDKSLAFVIAHEISHSWTGNLVTNRYVIWHRVIRRNAHRSPVHPT